MDASLSLLLFLRSSFSAGRILISDGGKDAPSGFLDVFDSLPQMCTQEVVQSFPTSALIFHSWKQMQMFGRKRIETSFHADDGLSRDGLEKTASSFFAIDFCLTMEQKKNRIHQILCGRKHRYAHKQAVVLSTFARSQMKECCVICDVRRRVK